MIRDAIRFILRALVALALLLGSLTAPPAAGMLDAEHHTPHSAGAARLTPDQAIALSVNDLQATANGYRLRHPRHVATFTPDGLQFTPRHGGPEWAWQLTAVATGDVPLAGVATGAMRPVREQPVTVVYARGGLVEQYLARQGSIEQQFIILRPLPLGEADLAIAGAVRSAGAFEETEDGWQWRTAEGAVRLGDVRAYDAKGRDLPARMTATATATRIVVDGSALARAAYPVTIDPEIGTDDFRLSDMGGDDLCDTWYPAVAYNSTNNEYLVVWYGDDDTPPLVEGEYEIFGQRVNAATGAEIGVDIRLSDMGPDGDASYTAWYPAVAYNSTDDEYLVVWSGDDDTGALVDDEFEIYGQRVDAATGTEIGADLRLSDMGPDGDTDYDTYAPAVAYNPTEDQYLVVWSGDDDTGALVDGEYEIYGQRVDAATGAEIGTDFRLSDMGPDGDMNYGVIDGPAVAYDPAGEYLVVWSGDDDTGPLANNEFEIFGQLVDAATGAEIGVDIRLSDMGPDGDASYDAWYPAVAYNPTDDEYLVVWSGDDDTPPLVEGEWEIYGQRVDAATGTEIGADLRLSDMGPDGDTSYGAYNPAVVYNPTEGQYLVVWYGDDDTGALVDNEYEIYGQRVAAATGAEVGTDLRLSDMGPDGDASYAAWYPAVAYNPTNSQYLVVWQGDDDTPPLVDEEWEIFGQRLEATTGAEVGANDLRLSDMGGDALFDAWYPAVAYNSTNDEYLVVWQGDDNTAGLVDGEFEIYGQRVDAATGAEIGVDIRLSDMGPDGDANYGAFAPAVAYNLKEDQYLVVWYGDDNTPPLVGHEYEIFGQRVDAATGGEIGADLRLSDMGPDGNASYGAWFPAVAYSSTNNEYLVVWQGDDDTGALVDNEYEIYGQRVNAATGGEIGADLRLSDMGPDGNADYVAWYPAVAYNPTDNEYLVVWWGDDDAGALVDNEYEIFGLRVEAATGAEIGADLRLSDMGPDGDVYYRAWYPAVAYNSAEDEYLVVWQGDDNTAPLVDEEYEIFGQRFASDYWLYLPLVLRE